MLLRCCAALLVLGAAPAAAQSRGAGKPPPLIEKQVAQPVPPKLVGAARAGRADDRSAPGTRPNAEASGTYRTPVAGSLSIFEAAPVPNRALDRAAVVAPQSGPTLEPSIIQRSLPSRGQAADGAPSRTEERLFDPAPGARLTVPFSYR